MDDPTVPFLPIPDKVSVEPSPVWPYLSSSAVALRILVPFTHVPYFRRQGDFFILSVLNIRLRLHTAGLKNLLAYLVCPLKLAQLLNFGHNDLAFIALEVPSGVPHIARLKVHRRVFDNILDQSLG